MEVVTAIVGKICNRLFDATWRQFGYLYRYKDTIKRLAVEAEKLADTRERVQAKIDEARTKGEIILSDANKWIQRADDITKEAAEFLKEDDKANKRCLKGMCIDPWSCYRFSKEAQRKIEAISNLRQEGEFESVSRQAPPPGIIAPSALSVNFQSRQSITKEIMKSLKEENVSIIGICGMGGVGKTTLVKEISKRAIENKLFDKVAMAVVSQTQNYVKIQGEIASFLDLKLPVNEEEPGRARAYAMQPAFGLRLRLGRFTRNNYHYDNTLMVQEKKGMNHVLPSFLVTYKSLLPYVGMPWQVWNLD
ncbi:hypothetical protein Ddye_018564 [Dipteronia dyeriana]|uniref:NB-ARC domain-containing protein n=1 Tax=Dipteronia dyeriana TaxID=168575 RepID=A0AAD9X243_9ROSI|nr:hypothetical protein Ddye_018564 [Dipteronia dyeriana]